MHGIESECRNRLSVDNLRIFNEMKIYSEEVSSRNIKTDERVELIVFEQKSQ